MIFCSRACIHPYLLSAYWKNLFPWPQNFFRSMYLLFFLRDYQDLYYLKVVGHWVPLNSLSFSSTSLDHLDFHETVLFSALLESIGVSTIWGVVLDLSFPAVFLSVFECVPSLCTVWISYILERYQSRKLMTFFSVWTDTDTYQIFSWETEYVMHQELSQTLRLSFFPSVAIDSV